VCVWGGGGVCVKKYMLLYSTICFSVSVNEVL
jgi:hypothetical protein